MDTNTEEPEMDPKKRIFFGSPPKPLPSGLRILLSKVRSAVAMAEIKRSFNDETL